MEHDAARWRIQSSGVNGCKRAVSRLRDRLKEVRGQEENQRRQIAYERVKTERDKLAAELKASCPSMEGRLGELIAKIEANDREIEFVNGHALPSGAERLRSAELIAREIEAWRVNLQTSCGQTRSALALRMAASTIGRWFAPLILRLRPLSQALPSPFF